MVTEAFRNFFNNGLDRDTNVLQYNNQSIFNTENIRIIPRGTLEKGAIVNIPGTKTKIQLGSSDLGGIDPNTVFNYLVGSTNIRDTLVLFLHRATLASVILNVVLPVPENEDLIFTRGDGVTYTFRFVTDPSQTPPSDIDAYLPSGGNVTQIAEALRTTTLNDDYEITFTDNSSTGVITATSRIAGSNYNISTN